MTTSLIDTDASWAVYPVDSTTRACCGGIGTHARDCASAWRDCQLTADQIATLERLEHEGTAPRTLTQVAAALQDANESMR